MPDPFASPDLDRELRARVYEHFIDTGRAPSAEDLAGALGTDVATVDGSLQRLAAAHALVLDPRSAEILMAHPFSATATDYPVYARGITYWANCAWDALGVPVLLGNDAVSVAACPDCAVRLTLEVRDGSVRSNADVVHFLVPARDFWRDIGFT